MIDGIEDLYQQIADSMTDSIPEEWKSARFDAIFFSDSSTYEAEYVRDVDGSAKGFQPTSAGSRAFRQIRKRFKEVGHPLWGQAHFMLFADGKFNMKWGYEGCDANGDTIFDEEQEIKRHNARHKRLTSG